MTHESVQQAIEALQASGQVASVRTVNRWLRSVPPWRGLRWASLLPLLKHPHVTGKECYAAVVKVISEIEAAISQPNACESLPSILAQGERAWHTCIPRLQAVSVSVDGATAAMLWPRAVQHLRYVLASATVTPVPTPTPVAAIPAPAAAVDEEEEAEIDPRLVTLVTELAHMIGRTR